MDILIDLVVSPIYAILAYLAYRYVYLPLRTRLNVFSRILPFHMGELVTICYGLIDSGSYFSIEEGDLSAIETANNATTENYGSRNVKSYGYQAVEGRLNEIRNLLCISGPRWNPVTRHFLGALGSPVMLNHRTETLSVMRSDGSSQVFQAKRRESDVVDECYGLILVGKLVMTNQCQQNITICAGINNISTFGSVVFLMGLRNRFLISRIRGLDKLGKAKTRHGFAIVIKVRNLSPLGMPSKLIPLDASHVNIEVVEVLGSEHFKSSFVLDY